MPKKVFASHSCSKSFALAMVRYGGIIVDCTACGRTHFTHLPSDYEEGEYEEYCKKEEENPDHYIGHPDDEPHYFEWEGRQIVPECPCNYAAVLERELWDHRYPVMEYFRGRSQRELETARGSQEAVRLTDEVMKQ